MQCIRIMVGRSGFDCEDGFHVYDASAGAIDWAHPLTPRKQLFWPGAEHFPGHLMGGHLARRHLNAMRPDGHLEGAHLMDCALRPAGVVRCELGTRVFGRFRYVLSTEDAAGNRGEAISFEMVVNSAPAGTSGLCPAAQLPGTGQMRFTFVPSRKLRD